MKPKIKYKFDYGCYPIWAVDDKSIDQFGFNISDLKGLGLSGKTIKLIEFNCEMFDNYLNPVYQMFPSFWSGRMHAFFQYSIKFLYKQITAEIGTEYEIENHEIERFNEKIDIEKIDNDLKSFVNNPAEFAIKKGISFNSSEELKAEIQTAFSEWDNKEYKYYSI